MNPRPAKWPEAEFIIGNPPFIGKGEEMRNDLGDGYIKALWASRGKRSDSIDYVMYWWDQAATILSHKTTKLRRFGFITTNSITQKFSRRIVEKHLKAGNPISLVFAVPDHPWQKVPKKAAARSKKAAVRIAMTVAECGSRIGRLAEVVDERDLGTDQPKVTLSVREGQINADLTLGTDVVAIDALEANNGIANNGMLLAGKGFILTPDRRAALGLSQSQTLSVVKRYVDGRDLTARSSENHVIDLFDLSEEGARKDYPKVYQYLLQSVFPHRRTNNRKSYRDRWWQFAEPRRTFRPALAGLLRYIATTETTKHRHFQFVVKNTMPDHMVVAIASDDAFILGVLSSRTHVVWATRVGGWLGVGNDPRYTKSLCFDTFPFPDANYELQKKICELADELDALRKTVIAKHDFLTMTKLYNVREKLKSGAPLNESEKAIHDAGCVCVIHELHNRIDAAVAEAYGWPADLPDEDILGRLVALNKERAEEEKRGIIRWLRPDYQVPRAKARAGNEEQIEADLELPEAVAPELPRDDAALVATLRQTLRMIGKPVEAKDIAQRFRDGARASRRVERGLNLLVAAGVVRRSKAGWFLPSDRAA